MTHARSAILFFVTLSAHLSAGCTLPQASLGAPAGSAPATQTPAGTPAGISCREIVQCSAACADSDSACSGACTNKGSAKGKAEFQALATCIEQKACMGDAACAQDKCSTALDACADTSAPTPEQGTGVPGGEGPVVVTIHAAALVREFETNIVRAKELYQGKRVRVFGTVNTVSPDGNRVALMFKSSITTYSNLFCRFPQDQAAGLANLHTGDDATADGTVVGLEPGRLILEGCSIP